MHIPQLNSPLEQSHIDFLQAFSKSCRYSILAMVNNAQSGHPGGSCSCIDYLSLLYTFIISQTGQPVIVSNGHVSPAVYGILAEMGYIPKQEVIETFRKIGSVYEGHVTRHVAGVWYGTGPLGIGISAASGMALSEKLRGTNNKVYGLLGDGEAQEGQVYEMMHFASKYKLDNFIAFVDFNAVQLTASLNEIMPIDLKATFEAAKWHVIEVDGHDYKAMWKALDEAHGVTGKPVVIIGHTIMGKGIALLEPDGRAHKSTWHGKSPKPEESEKALQTLELTDDEKKRIEDFLPLIAWKPAKPEFKTLLRNIAIDSGEPMMYTTEKETDCRSAYGTALLDLVKRNKNIVALCADLRGSVKTDGVADNVPERHIEVGIAEQHMVSCAGGMSLDGLIPFASTFGAFMTSRAKDQARVNDINDTNVKMVATHCGLSVGEDGPTHQAIDDMGSFLGLFNTMVIEPADPNQTDRIIRYIASHYGNFYVRMGRHKFPIVTKPDGSPFYDKNYVYDYGKCDVVHEGKDITIAATGAMVYESLQALEMLKKTHPKLSVEVVAVSSIKKFDQTLFDSVKKTKKVITVEDHNVFSGLGCRLAGHLELNHVSPEVYKTIGVTGYQLSGTVHDLYRAAGIDAEAIAKACTEIVS